MLRNGDCPYRKTSVRGDIPRVLQSRALALMHAVRYISLEQASGQSARALRALTDTVDRRRELVKSKIIVTDLTRFRKLDKVCTAGIIPSTGQCVRPMPYLETAVCEKLSILPGAILEGDFSPVPDAQRPHVEDMFHKNLMFLGPAGSADFRNVLARDARPSVEEAFSVDLDRGQKHIPPEQAPACSIVTVAIAPGNLEVVADRYDETKIKLIFTDQAGQSFRFIAITDLGFFRYAEAHRATSDDFTELNNHIGAQGELFLRLGLGRVHETSDGRKGYWIQANGIYTFPQYFPGTRSYGN